MNVPENPAGTDATASYSGTQNVVKAEKSSDATPWPFIQTYTFSSTIEIQYNKAGGAQISTLTYDDVDSVGLSLDRSAYPAGAHVHVTIEDNRLNIDPTSDDIWTWNVESGMMYYMIDTDSVDTGVYPLRVIPTTGTIDDAARTIALWDATSACADCILLIEPNRQNEFLAHNAVLELDAGLTDLPIRATADKVDEVVGVEDDRDTLGIDETVTPVTPVTPEMWFTVAGRRRTKHRSLYCN